MAPCSKKIPECAKSLTEGKKAEIYKIHLSTIIMNNMIRYFNSMMFLLYYNNLKSKMLVKPETINGSSDGAFRKSHQ